MNVNIEQLRQLLIRAYLFGALNLSSDERDALIDAQLITSGGLLTLPGLELSRQLVKQALLVADPAAWSGAPLPRDLVIEAPEGDTH